jgi:hypothetical protein
VAGAAGLANLDQLATATESVVSASGAAGARAVDLRVWGGIDLRLPPERGLDSGGIEPADCSVLGRAHDIAAGRMPFLDRAWPRALG